MIVVIYVNKLGDGVGCGGGRVVVVGMILLIMMMSMLIFSLYLDESLDELTRIQQAAIPLVLGLLGNSVGELALCHNSLLLVKVSPQNCTITYLYYVNIILTYYKNII